MAPDVVALSGIDLHDVKPFVRCEGLVAVQVPGRGIIGSGRLVEVERLGKLEEIAAPRPASEEAPRPDQALTLSAWPRYQR